MRRLVGFLLRYQAPTQAAGPGPRRGGASGPRVGTVGTVSGRGAALGVPPDFAREFFNEAIAERLDADAAAAARDLAGASAI
jgi:hypothetical protein